LIPTASNFKTNLSAKGFTNEEIVALASIDALSAVHAQDLGKATFFEKIDNTLYQQIAQGKTSAQLA